jgi:hypothetical protein
MAKRFIDTSLWTQNKWFRKLKPKHKLFWVYLICNCDTVGVWEEDFELASYIIGEEFSKSEIDEIFAEKIKWFCGKKLWIVDFCNFQYGPLIEENKNNKPHQSYINLLKKHSLWIEYEKSFKRLKDKDKEKDMDKEKDFIGKIIDCFIEEHGSYEIITLGKEREMAGKILNLYKKKYPDSNSDETLNGLRQYFKMCLNISDQWLKNNMSLSIIVSKFNEINKILKNGTNRSGGATSEELTELIAGKLGINQ